jgi:serine-type D-Ala-D-Ala endopeptidase (penicillin-binding protein 7)
VDAFRTLVGVKRTLNRILHTVALAAFVLALTPVTPADAGQARRAAKKPAVVKTVRAAKTFKASPRMTAAAKRRSIIAITPPKPSYGQLAGLHSVSDILDLKSSVAYVIDQDTREVLVRKNDSAVLPIASITKLMTGLIVSEARLPLDETITITDEDVDTEKHSRSRLTVGTTITRREAMHLALMSSENRAAHALGRTYPGGMAAFVSAMNTKARQLGMKDTQYVEPTGLSSRNQSSAQDLATLVNLASQDPMLREFSTSPGAHVEVGNRLLAYNNTNRLVHNPNWEIGLQKTGYISEAGQCLVMQVKVAGRQLIMVFLDSAGKLSRIGDAERVRKWLETHVPGGVVPAVPSTNTIIRQVNG